MTLEQVEELVLAGQKRAKPAEHGENPLKSDASQLRNYILEYGYQLGFIDQKCSLFKLKPGASSRLPLLPFIQLLLDMKGIYVNGYRDE